MHVDDRLLAAASRVAKADREGWARLLAVFQEATSGYYARCITADTVDAAEFGRLQGYARTYTKLLELLSKAPEYKEPSHA